MGRTLEKPIFSNDLTDKKPKSRSGAEIIYPKEFHPKKNKESKANYEKLLSVVRILGNSSYFGNCVIPEEKIKPEDLKDERFDINLTKGEYSGVHARVLPDRSLHIYFAEKVGDPEGKKRKLVADHLKKWGWDGKKIDPELRAKNIMKS